MSCSIPPAAATATTTLTWICAQLICPSSAALDRCAQAQGQIRNIIELPDCITVRLTSRAPLEATSRHLTQQLTPRVLRCNPIYLFTPGIERLPEPHLLWPRSATSSRLTPLEQFLPGGRQFRSALRGRREP
jgi:hypothetical protein